jgi:hypothetical protein
MKKSQSKSQNPPRTKLKGYTAGIMLSTLEKKYPAFADFYSANKPDIDKITITWVIDSTAKKDGMTSPATDTIILKKFPKSPEGARIVAHELEHLLIWKEGYPCIIANPQADADTYRQLEPLAQVIQEPVFEPMVEWRIKKYFKKSCADHHASAMKGLAKLIENKAKILPELNDPRKLLYYSCLYVQKRLVLEATCDPGKADEYTRKFTTHFGDTILPCAEKVLALIQKHTTRSPESVREIFEGILWNRNCAFGYRFYEEFDRFVLDR